MHKTKSPVKHAALARKIPEFKLWFPHKGTTVLSCRDMTHPCITVLLLGHFYCNAAMCEHSLGTPTTSRQKLLAAPRHTNRSKVSHKKYRSNYLSDKAHQALPKGASTKLWMQKLKSSCQKSLQFSCCTLMYKHYTPKSRRGLRYWELNCSQHQKNHPFWDTGDNQSLLFPFFAHKQVFTHKPLNKQWKLESSAWSTHGV